MNAPGTHHVRLTFGKHRDELLTRVPVSYLKFMVANRTPQAELAEAELKRRGTVTPTIEVSGHAVDRASLSCRALWHETRTADEGLHAWLVRMATEALGHGVVNDRGRHEYRGMQFAFELTTAWPILKTVMPAKHRGNGHE